MWEVSTGQLVSCPLSDIIFPYPIRGISWHPKQHLIAVSSVGVGASLCIYGADRESADAAVKRATALEADANIANIFNNMNGNAGAGAGAGVATSASIESMLGSGLGMVGGDSAAPGFAASASGKTAIGKDALRLNLGTSSSFSGQTGTAAESKGSPLAPSVSMDAQAKAQRAKDILEKIRAERKL